MELEIINSSGELCLYGFFCKQLVMLHLCNILHKYLITNFGELIHIGPGLAKLLVNGFWYGTLDKWYRIYIDILFVDKKVMKFKTLIMCFSFIYFIFCNDHFENKIWCMYFLYNQQGSSLAIKKTDFLRY